jgi:hypothetical protein
MVAAVMLLLLQLLLLLLLVRMCRALSSGSPSSLSYI